MYHIGREAVTSVGQLQGRDRKAVVDQVNLIPHWSKGNFGELCPLPTLADKLLFILTYLKQNPIQEVQGQLFGMSQSNANKWIHVLHPVLNQALADQELLPARTAAEFAAMFETHSTDGGSTTPLFGMMALNVRSTARPIPKSNKNITAARRSVTRSKISS